MVCGAAELGEALELAHLVHGSPVLDAEELDGCGLLRVLTSQPVLLDELKADIGALGLHRAVFGVGRVEVDAVVVLKLLDVDSVLILDLLVLCEGHAELQELLGDFRLLLWEKSDAIVF